MYFYSVQQYPWCYRIAVNSPFFLQIVTYVGWLLQCCFCLYQMGFTWRRTGSGVGGKFCSLRVEGTATWEWNSGFNITLQLSGVNWGLVIQEIWLHTMNLCAQWWISGLSSSHAHGKKVTKWFSTEQHADSLCWIQSLRVSNHCMELYF